MSVVHDPRRMWLATGSLLTVWWRMTVSGTKIGAGPCLLALAVTLLPLCLWWGIGACMQPIALFGIRSILCSVSRPDFALEPFTEEFFFFFSFLSLAMPLFGLLSQVSSLRLSSGHSGLVLILSTDYAAHTSLSSPRSLVVDMSVQATSLLTVVVGHILCGFLFFFFVSQLCCPLRFQNSPQTHL